MDRVRKPLEPPYEGPFQVIERISDRIFTILMNGQNSNINVDILKPAYIEAAATQEPAHPGITMDDDTNNTSNFLPALRTYPSAKGKTTKKVTFAATS